VLLADLPTWVIDTGSAAGVVAAVTAALAVVTRARPVRWLWRVTISDPVSRWAAGVVGDSVADVSARLTDHMDEAIRLRKADTAEREERQAEHAAFRSEVVASLAAGAERMKALEEGHREIKGMLAETLDELKAGNPEVRP
jgi:uncharacterized protein (UPF0335 family)